MHEDQRGLLPILGPLSRQRNFCRDRVSLALCLDMVFRVKTGFSRQAYDPALASVIGMFVHQG